MLALEQAPSLRSPQGRALNRHQRRAVHSSRIGLDYDLTKLAFEKLVTRLEGFGNVLSEAHKEALMCIVGRFTHLSNGTKTGRWGYALPCGAGKTAAAKAWCWALWSLQKPYSVAISASKVEALCELKRGLIELGVDDEAIGLSHSYKFDPALVEQCRANGEQLPNGNASLPCTSDNDNRQIVLLTHNKIRGQANTGDRLPLYRNKPRSLLIYDESLLISDTWTLSMTRLDQAKGWLEPLVKRHANVPTETSDAYAYTARCIELLDEELAAQIKRSPQPVQLPALDSETQEQYIAALKELQVRPLRHLVSWSQSPMRVVATNSGGGSCWYKLSIPHDLKSVCVLDASLVIRQLPKIGERLQTDTAFRGEIKTNANVEIAQMFWRSGRRAMEAAFTPKREDRTISKEVIEVVKSIPQDQGIIIWSFKHRETNAKAPNILDTLKSDLSAAGVDTNATIATPKGPKARFAFLTWGNETSTNDYAYCSNVIMAGVLHRDDIDLAANVIGQKDDLLADHGDLHEIKKSEVAHVVYQALSRGSCRQIINGEASPMRAWLLHHDATLENTIRSAMPGVQWREWEPKFIKGAATRKTKTTADTIIAYLKTLPSEIAQVSTRKIKDALGLGDMPRMTFSRAVQLVPELISGWALDGRSLVRQT